MVVFTCNSCGSTLKKNQVERHMGSCGRIVCCIDCLKDFRGDEFKLHVKCISEAEKYNGPDWKPSSSQNKGERKQVAWIETVNAVLDKGKQNMTPGQIALLKAISKHDNVPRKKAKFLNFVRNIARNSFDPYTIDAVWDNVEAEWKRQAEKAKPALSTNGVKSHETAGNGTGSGEENGQGQEEVEDDVDGCNKKKHKKSKRKLEEDVEITKSKKKKGNHEKETVQDGDAEDSVVPDSTTEFSWGDVIKRILSSREDNSISIKKLKKKVFAEYYAVVGDSKGVKSKEDLASQLNKKLKKKTFKVVGENVSLVLARVE